MEPKKINSAGSGATPSGTSVTIADKFRSALARVQAGSQKRRTATKPSPKPSERPLPHVWRNSRKEKWSGPDIGVYENGDPLLVIRDYNHCNQDQNIEIYGSVPSWPMSLFLSPKVSVVIKDPKNGDIFRKDYEPHPGQRLMVDAGKGSNHVTLSGRFAMSIDLMKDDPEQLSVDRDRAIFEPGEELVVSAVSEY